MPRDTAKTEQAIDKAKKAVVALLKKAKEPLKRGEIVADLSANHAKSHVETAIRILHREEGGIKGEQRGSGPKAPYFYSI